MGKLCRIGSHEADLAAHTRDQWEVLRTGDNYVLPLLHYNSCNRVLTVDRLYAIIFVVPRALTVDRIAIGVETLAAGKSVRLGIYNVGTNLYPGTLLLDAGVVSVATTGIKTITINQKLTKGIYFVSYICDGGPKLRCYYPIGSLLGSDPGNFAGVVYGGWYKNDTYGALPDPYPASGGKDSGYNAARLRASSMD